MNKPSVIALASALSALALGACAAEKAPDMNKPSTKKVQEGACGEGTCAAAPKAKEGSCAASKTMEGKCAATKK